MKKDNTIIKLFEKIINSDFSDALKMQCKQALTIYKNINTIDELEVFNYQFSSLINICRYYLNN